MFTQKNKVRLAAICSVILLLGLWGCQTPAGRTAGEVVDDGTITTKVKAKLFEDDALSGFAISAETFEGEVTLTGSVDSLQNKERATQLAESVYGVKNVNNLLKIK
jgi:hyperosmotically inducible protein